MSVNGLENNQTNLNEILQWVTFQLGSEQYGVNVLQVQEVLKFTEITPVPGAPHYVLGIINLRGNVVTVIDSRLRFGLGQKQPDDATRIIFVEVKGHIIGMLVDSVAEVVSMRSSDIETSPTIGKEDNESSKYLQGVYSTDDKILILIDVEKLFSEEDLAEVVGF
ncbi:MAG: chemotaxis protein CheW [Gammaproteobacteria bacterium]